MRVKVRLKKIVNSIHLHCGVLLYGTHSSILRGNDMIMMRP